MMKFLHIALVALALLAGAWIYTWNKDGKKVNTRTAR